MALNRRLDAVHLSNIHAHSNDQDASSAPAFGPAAHSDYTVRVVAPTKTLKPKRKVRERPAVGQTCLSVSFGRSNSNWVERKVRGVQILQLPTLTKIPWLVHGFSTRPGGVSLMDKEKVLNLGFTEWDTKENVLENCLRFQSALGASNLKLISLKQIHSDVIHLFDAAPAQPCQGDASSTNRPGLLLGVQTADCVPILLVDPQKRAIAAVHAGWRGTLQRIVVKAIGQMQMQFKSKPADLLAAIGPAIGGCCYEVGTEVAIQFQSQFADAHEWFDEFRTGDEPNPIQWLNMMPPGHQPPPKNVLLDLRKANRAQLLGAGLRAPNVFVSDLCTACRRDLLFSYRKEGALSGRLMSVIGIQPS
ncbi:MAG TPA: peptidoglycan editing factor PgeF [Candidatus Acidoferrum sp.]|nr:peptidoglycan editing factor PgeF [Candidatus Acidoferrum sp.]